MKAIGGYFELELAKGNAYHENAVLLNSGRFALQVIIEKRGYKKIYLPYYTCDVLMGPIESTGIEYSFYSIDRNLEPVFDFGMLKDYEAFLYTNYFGLKERFINTLPQNDCNIIIDNCQAFYSRPLSCFDTFYSARKFFGVPDGSYLYLTGNDKDTGDIRQGFSFDRCGHLLKRIDLGAEGGYADFIASDASIDSCGVERMSKLSEKMLAAVPYGEVASTRKDNFNYLHSRLKKYNEFVHDVLNGDSVPLIYPLLVKNDNLRQVLIVQKIFVPCYWANVFEWAEETSLEYYIAKNLIALPIDQRYTIEDMKYVADAVEKSIMPYTISKFI